MGNNSTLLSKIPFLSYFLALGIIASVLYEISGYQLVHKEFPVHIFTWGFLFAGILFILINVSTSINPTVKSAIANIIAIFTLLAFIIIASAYIYQDVIEPMLEGKATSKTEEKPSNGAKLSVTDLSTAWRKISFSYDYLLDTPAAITASLIPLDENQLVYPDLVKGKELNQGINKINIDFEDLNWEYLNFSELDLKIRIFLSYQGGSTDIIEELLYQEQNGTPQTYKYDTSPP
jgi:hypothetical protein